jgi:hypothetical protein
MLFFQSARMDTPQVLTPIIDYELRHLIFPCLWRRGRWIPVGLVDWWIGSLIGPGVGRYNRTRV